MCVSMDDGYVYPLWLCAYIQNMYTYVMSHNNDGTQKRTKRLCTTAPSHTLLFLKYVLLYVLYYATIKEADNRLR